MLAFGFAAADMGMAVDLLVILASAAIVILAFQRLKLALIPAYLITGALIGPHALRLGPAPELLQDISHLAIILLMFGIGLELHLDHLRHGLARMVTAGIGACLGVALAAWPLAIACGLASPSALAFTMAISMSSTAVVLGVLASRRETRTLVGRLSFAILILQDLIVLGYLAALPLLARWASLRGDLPGGTGEAPLDGAAGWGPFVLNALVSLLGVAALILVGRWVIPLMIRESVRSRGHETILIVGVAVTLAAAFLTQQLGFSLEMGAFLAGFLLAASPFRHQLSGQIGTLRDLFIAVFFTTLGMNLQLQVLVDWWWIVLLATVGVVVLKTVLIGGVCWALGTSLGTALAVGLVLSQAGEFSLILLGVARAEAILDDQVVALGIAVVVLSLILTPSLMGIAGKVRLKFTGGARAFAGDDEAGAPPGGHHVIIGGFGPIGRLVAGELEQAGVSHTIVELNAKTVRRESAAGRKMVYGNVASREVLIQAGLHEAEGLILTIPDDQSAMRASTVARSLSPDLFIVLRTGLLSRLEAAEKTGANKVVVEEQAAAHAMVEAVVGCMNDRDILARIGEAPEQVGG